MREGVCEMYIVHSTAVVFANNYTEHPLAIGGLLKHLCLLQEAFSLGVQLMILYTVNSGC